MATKVTYTLEVDASGAKNALTSTSAEAKKTAKTFDELEKETIEAQRAQSSFGQVSAKAGQEASQALNSVGISAKSMAKDVADATKQSTEDFKAERGSIEDLNGRIAALVETRNKINDPAIVAGINDRIKALNDEKGALEGATKEVEKSSLFDRAKAGSLGLVQKAFAAVGIDISGYVAANKAATAAMGVTTGAARTLKVALVSTGIGALVVGVGLLIGAMMKLQPVMDKIQQVTAGIGGAFDFLTDRVGAFLGMNEKSNVSLAESIRLRADLKRQEQELLDTEIIAIPIRERLRAQIENLRTATRDENVTNEQKIELLDEAIKAEEKLTEIEQYLASERLRNAKERARIAVDDREANRELAEAEANLINIESQSARRRRQMSTERLGLVLQQRDADQRAADAKQADDDAELERIKKINDAEAENERKRIVALTERADQYRDLLKTEEELTQEAFDKELEQLEELYAAKLLSDKEYAELRALIEQELMDRLVRIRAAKTAKVEEQDDKEELSSEDLKKARIKNELEVLGATIGAQAEMASSFKEATKGIIFEYLKRLAAAVFTLVASKIPPPFGTVAGAAAAGLSVAAARSAVNAIPGFRDGGLTPAGRRIIEVNEDGGRPEFVVNADATARNLPLLQAINSGANMSGGATFNDGGFADRMGGVASKMENISISLDLEDVIRTIDDRTRINTERNINTP